MARKILVTSALLYANGPLHIGHLIEYIETDIYVRFLRMKGSDVVYCCADDTHGAPVQINAEKAGMTPEQFIAKYYEEHVRDFKAFHISFDNYYTTHSKENKHYSDQLFNAIKEKGHIYKKTVEQLHCESCGRFLPDRYVKGECPKCHAKDQYGDVCEVCGSTHRTTDLIDARCAVCGKIPQTKSSEHFFFRLSAFTKQLDEWLLGNKHLQKEIVHSVRQWITEGLADWDISRDGPYFGFKIPDTDNLYYYVWFDAPIGYIASTENHCAKHGLSADEYWRKDSDIIHFIGKDIIYFHFLFWPAVLMAAGFTLPKQVVVHGFLTVNGEKMSKSRGTFITAEEYLKTNDAEHLRYYYASMLSTKLADIDMRVEDLLAKVNNELVANIGNFCHRTLSFTNKFLDSKVAGYEERPDITGEVDRKMALIAKHYDDMNLRDAVKEILALSTLGNRYLQESAPWKTIKEDKEKTGKVLGLAIQIVKNLAIACKPILPLFSHRLEQQLGMKDLAWKDAGFAQGSHTIDEAKILVSRIELKRNILPFAIRVAKVVHATPHPDADKLMVLELDLADEDRQIVAGVRQFYSPEQLIGRKILVLTNLKPAKLRGSLSQGMLLAAEHDGVVKVIFADESEIGDMVTLEGYEVLKKEISFEEFQRQNKLAVKDGMLTFDGLPLSTSKAQIRIDMPDGSSVR
jgi:methionyl-tRNA synthetase